MKRSLQTHRAFTLLEVIVVIGIVVLLTALTVTVAVGVIGKSEIRNAESTMKLLDTALDEWQGDAARQITWGVNDLPYLNATYELNPDTPQVSPDRTAETMLNIVLDEIRNVPAAHDMLRQLDGSTLRGVDVNGEHEIEVFDPWDHQMYVIHPGRVADPRTFSVDAGKFTDEDGTIRVSHTSIDSIKSHPDVSQPQFAWEAILGVCKSRRLCFVSAGPDGEFGNLSATPDTPEFKATLDNIYSYPVGKP